MFTELYINLIPDLEQEYRSPGCPFMVKASDILGAPPVRIASFITSMGLLFHHSPVQ
jgi:hypothetical protein